VLGIKVQRDLTKRTMRLTQTAYATKVLERFGLRECRPKSTPDSATDMDEAWDDDEAEQADATVYRAMVGSIGYLASCTRPDLAFTAQRLATRLHDPRTLHLMAAKRALRYLLGTIDLGIELTAKATKLEGWCDASWAPKPDRKSVSGFIALIGNAPVAWKSVRQRVVALSSCEAEYIAMAELAKELLWLRNLLADLGLVQGPTIVYCDNKSAIATALHTSVKARSKHIDTRHHFLRQLVEDKTIEVVYAPTTSMLADCLTKKANNHALAKFQQSVMAKASIQGAC